MAYVFRKNRICFILSVFKKQHKHTTPIYYVWRYKDFEAQREDNVASRLSWL